MHFILSSAKRSATSRSSSSAPGRKENPPRLDAGSRLDPLSDCQSEERLPGDGLCAFILGQICRQILQLRTCEENKNVPLGSNYEAAEAYVIIYLLWSYFIT